NIAHQTAQTVSHLSERVAQRVIRGAWLDFYTQVSTRNCFGNRCHLFEIDHHAAKGAAELPDLIVAPNINFVVQVSGLANLLRDANEFRKWLGNRVRCPKSNNYPKSNRNESEEPCDQYRDLAGARVTLFALLENLVRIVVGDFERVGGSL